MLLLFLLDGVWLLIVDSEGGLFLSFEKSLIVLCYE